MGLCFISAFRIRAVLSLTCQQQLGTCQGQTVCALLPWSEAMSRECFRVNPMTNVLGSLLSSVLSRGALPIKSNNQLGSQSLQMSKLRQPTAHTSVSFLKVGSMDGLLLACWRMPWFMLSPHSLKWRLSQGHAGTLIDRPLPFNRSPPVFWSVLHCEAASGPERTGGPSDTLTSKQPNFSF